MDFWPRLIAVARRSETRRCRRFKISLLHGVYCTEPYLYDTVLM